MNVRSILEILKMYSFFIKSIEEIKTTRNSDGKEVKTVTRIIGDKSHSVIEKKNKNVIEETEEFFQNFDHGKIINLIKYSIGNNQVLQTKPRLNFCSVSYLFCSVFYLQNLVLFLTLLNHLMI